MKHLLEQMKFDEDAFTRWKKLGLLEGIKDSRLQRHVANNYEECARDILGGSSLGDYWNTIIFPMIRRIITHERIVNLGIYVSYGKIIGIMSGRTMAQFMDYFGRHTNEGAGYFLNKVEEYCSQHGYLDEPIIKFNVPGFCEYYYETGRAYLMIDTEAELCALFCDYIIDVLIRENNERKY